MAAAARAVRIGDRVRFYTRRYIKGSRGPGRPARYAYSFCCEGVLLAKSDLRAYAHEPGITQAEVDRRLGMLAVANATGGTVAGDLTEGNNPVLLDRLPPGHLVPVVWAYAEQVRPVPAPKKAKAAAR